jgi:CysZ protein
MRELARGAHDVSRGLAALRRFPSLWRWLVAPAALTLVILVAIIATIAHFFSAVLGPVEAHLPSFIASVAGTLLAVLVIAGLAMGGLLVLATVAGVISGPFNERLSEHLEAKLTGRPSPPFALSSFVHELARGATHAVRRVAVAIAGTVFVIALGFVPGIGSAAALVLGFYFAARATAYDCYDAVLGRRAISYRAKLAYLEQHRSRTLGLGAATAAMLLVPGLNLIALGLGAAGATVAMLEGEARS